MDQSGKNKIKRKDGVIVGWKGESRRHSLARKGIRTNIPTKAKGLGKVTTDQEIRFEDDYITFDGKPKYLKFDYDIEQYYLSLEEYEHPDDFKFKIAIQVMDAYAMTGDDELEGKYWVTLYLIPKLKGEERVEMISDIGYKDPDEDLIYIESLSYGYNIQLNNELVEESEVNKYIEEFVVEGDIVPTLSGFYLDRYVNRIGDTGWDRLREYGVMDR